MSHVLIVFFETLSGEVFESIGPPFRELWATILETSWEQRGKVETVLSRESEPSESRGVELAWNYGWNETVVQEKVQVSENSVY